MWDPQGGGRSRFGRRVYGYCVECDGWRRRPSLWTAHNVLYQQHVDLWWIYPTKPEVGVYKLQPILQWNSIKLYPSSRMFLSCNLCMIFDLFLLFFRLSSPVIYINSTNKLEWIWFLVFCWVSHGNHSVRGRSTEEDQGSFLTPTILECSYCYTDGGKA